MSMSGWTVAGTRPGSPTSAASESTRLIKGGGGSSPELTEEPDDGLAHPNDGPWEALGGMFLDNKINVLFGFLPFAYLSHAAGWPDSSVFILNFLAMVPLASMLGIFTEELAAHTNDVIGGLINATFGNAVELVVAVQALLHNGEKMSPLSKTLCSSSCRYFRSIKFTFSVVYAHRLPRGPVEFDWISVLQPATSFGNVFLLRRDVLPGAEFRLAGSRGIHRHVGRQRPYPSLARVLRRQRRGGSYNFEDQRRAARIIVSSTDVLSVVFAFLFV